MAGASTAWSDDASAAVTNPAGLSQVQRKEIVTSYADLFDNTNFSVFNFAQPTVDIGTFGVGLVSLQSKNFDRRDANGMPSGTFATSEMAMLLSHGMEVNDRLSLGSTLKIIREDVASFSGTGYGLDGGAQMRINPNVNVGMTVRNVLAPSIKLRDEKDPYPFEVRAGAKWLALKKLTMAFDLDKTAGRSLKPILGGEWSCNPILVLRGGISETEITTGIGIQLKDWGLDYAFSFNDAAAGAVDLGASHRFGFHINFGKRVFEQEASLRWQKKGQAVLAQLRAQMDDAAPKQAELEKVLSDARQVIRRQGFLKAEDLYAAQGYISYFAGEYERSVQSLGESLALDPHNEQLGKHLEKARAQMTQEQTREITAAELKRMKDLYDKGDWRGTVKSCEKILSFLPDNIDATMYMEDARKHINEPIERGMKIAKAKFERSEFLDAIKVLQQVKELDPENKEAADLITQSIAALEKQASAAAAVSGPAAPPAVYEVERNSDQSRQLYSKGLVLYSQGNLIEAAQLWERAVQYDSQNALARSAFNRAQVEIRESR